MSVCDLLTGLIHPVTSQMNSDRFVSGYIVKYLIFNGIVFEIAILARADSAGAQLYKLAAAKQLTPFFSQQALAEASEILNNPGINDASLTDLEHKAFCTIDGIDTLDLDQALHVEKIRTGYAVRYAIADAAYYVKPGSALFTEALQRGASYYLPGLMIPMLPRELCLGVISLNENVSRRAVIFEMELDESGCLQQTKVFRAKIKSRAKLSFEEVQSFLSQASFFIRNDADLSASLRCFQAVGLLRLKLSEERNVARYHRTDINIKLGDNGLVFKLLDNVRNDVELYNEQLSLLCNTVGAMLLANGDGAENGFIQPVYKVHPPPALEKLQAFETAINRMIQLHKLNPELWQWHHDGAKSLAEYLKSLPQTGAEAGLTQAIHRQAIMANARSMFSEHPGRHYGVGAEVYARFSAPMREIVGVFLHKELMETLSINRNDSKERDEALRTQIIQAANRAKDVQNQLTNEANLLVLDQVFSPDLALPESQRPVREGIVIGLGRDKLYILLNEISIEIKLYVKLLEAFLKKSLYIDQERLSLFLKGDEQPWVCLGDGVDITVVGKDQDKHRWIFFIQAKSRH